MAFETGPIPLGISNDLSFYDMDIFWNRTIDSEILVIKFKWLHCNLIYFIVGAETKYFCTTWTEMWKRDPHFSSFSLIPFVFFLQFVAFSIVMLLLLGFLWSRNVFKCLKNQLKMFGSAPLRTLVNCSHLCHICRKDGQHNWEGILYIWATIEQFARIVSWFIM